MSHTLLPHVRQSHSWDCGLACVGALLAARNAASSTTGSPLRTHASLVAAALATIAPSVWTIDLAAILLECGVAPTMYTTAPDGAPPAHAALAFYAAHFERDVPRVAARFTECRARGLRVIEGSLTREHLRARLLEGALFIALVDMRWVDCRDCAPAPGFVPPCFTYAGHYVVVTRYCEARGGFEYMDPSKDAPRCFIDSDAFDRARRSAGTDEDLLEISLR